MQNISCFKAKNSADCAKISKYAAAFPKLPQLHANKTMNKKIFNIVAAFIYENGKFLICQRPENKARALLWEFAGGKVEQGENPEQALARECREELAITVEVGELFYKNSHEYEDIIVSLFIYHTKILQGPIQKLEHNDIRWISSSEIDQYEFCPADVEVLELIKENY